MKMIYTYLAILLFSSPSLAQRPNYDQFWPVVIPNISKLTEYQWHAFMFSFRTCSKNQMYNIHPENSLSIKVRYIHPSGECPLKMEDLKP